VVAKTGRVLATGSQQRSDSRFRLACELVRNGRIGKVTRVECRIGANPVGTFKPSPAPKGLDWDFWQGPCQNVDYVTERCHYQYRWWYEYSGGKLTDWGAHHVDIATWGLGKTDTGPVSVNPVQVTHPVPFKDGYPTDPSRYNTATEFLIEARFADDVEIVIRHDGDNGILFEGSDGRIFVNRGKLSGAPVEDLARNPLPPGAIERAYKGRVLTDHFRNFFESVRDRTEPISDVFSHHRALSTCHLAGIASRLNRKIEWDPAAERISGDRQAQSFVARDNRKGFEIEVS
jgi:predicted dehydrogenase